MMRRLFHVVIGALALIGLLAGQWPLAADSALPARTNDTAAVRVVVTPTAVGVNMKVWEFKVVMDTHSKALNENLMDVAVLVDDSGRRYAPMSWQGTPPGGHHREGILRFAAPAKMPRQIELQIDRIGGAGIRKFQWQLQ